MALTGLQAFIDQGVSDMGLACVDLASSAAYLRNCKIQCQFESWVGLGNALDQAGRDLARAQEHLGYTYQGALCFKTAFRDTLELINNNWPEGGGGVDMDQILSAMVQSSFAQLTSFMGITQAYKTAVWDAPFNEEYYAALARGFKTWGA